MKRRLKEIYHAPWPLKWATFLVGILFLLAPIAVGLFIMGTVFWRIELILSSFALLGVGFLLCHYLLEYMQEHFPE